MKCSPKPPRIHSHAQIFQQADLPALLVSNWREEWNDVALKNLKSVVIEASDAGYCLVAFVGARGRVNAELVVPADRVRIPMDSSMTKILFFRISGSEGSAQGVSLSLQVRGGIAAAEAEPPEQTQATELNFETYWDSALARAGGLGVIFEDGIANLLVPKALEDRIEDMIEGAQSVTIELLSRDRWKTGEICMQWSFEDGSERPFTIQFGTTSILGRAPNVTESSRPVEIWIKDGRAALCVASLEGTLKVQATLQGVEF